MNWIPRTNRYLLCLFSIVFCYIGTRAQTCQCSTKGQIDAYQHRIERLVEDNGGCDSCVILPSETLLVYDAMCKKFLFRDVGNGQLRVLTDLNDLKLHYKRPLRFKLVNFNRYIYNLNYASADIAFTSSMPQVMQQYLFPVSGNATVTPANTYTNGGSENGGGYVYANIAAFRANMDQFLAKVMAATIPLTVEQATGKYAGYLNRLINLASLKKLDTFFTPNAKAVIHNFSTTLDSLNLKQLTEKDTSKMDSLNHFYDSLRRKTVDAFIKVSDTSLTKIVAKGAKLPDKKAAKDASTMLDSLPLVHKDLQQSVFEDGVLREMRSNTHDSALKVLHNILNLEAYCDSFLDDRIKAYSLCTTYDSLHCCENPQERYRRFNDLEEVISASVYEFKKALTIYDSTKAMFDRLDSQEQAAASKKTMSKADSIKASKPLEIKVSAADYVFTNGVLTGLKIQQIPDTSKPKASASPSPSPTDPFLLIDSLWNQFEKNISTEYIMRQIIFHNNLVRRNISYTSPPIYPYGDRLGLVMQITPSDSVIKMGTAPIQSEAISLDFAVSDRPLFSFSAGTFAGVWLRSKTYDWRQIPSAGTNIIQSNSPYTLMKTGDGSTPVGFDGMANVTWRWFLSRSKWAQNNIRLGLSGGVGAVVQPTPIRIGYLLGPTVSVGLYQQFHFSVGVNFMNVNKLKDDLNNNYVYSSNPGIDIYNQKIAAGGFISISYTIFSPKSSGAGNVNSASAPAVNSSGTSTPASK